MNSNCEVAKKNLYWSIAFTAPIVVWAGIGLLAGMVVDAGYPSGKKVFLDLLEKYGAMTLGGFTFIGLAIAFGVIIEFASKSSRTVDDAKGAIYFGTIFPVVAVGECFQGFMSC